MSIGRPAGSLFELISVPEAVTARGEFRRGVRLIMPVLPGTAAWGLVSGVAMLKTGLTSEQALAMTLLMYAGSAQLACLPLIAAGAPWLVTLSTAAIVNLRFIIYGLGLVPAFRNEAPPVRLLLGYLNADRAGSCSRHATTKIRRELTGVRCISV